MNKLKSADPFDESQLKSLKLEVLAKCMDESHQKVKLHARGLGIRLQNIAKLINDEKGSDSTGISFSTGPLMVASPEVSLLDWLKVFLDEYRHDYCRLSLEAYAFRKNPLYARLKILTSERTTSAAEWSALRHHIGRLGSWAKSAESIVRVGRNKNFRRLLKSLDCHAVPQPEPLSLRIVDPEENYRQLLQRAFPELDIDRLQERFDICTRNGASIRKSIGELRENDPQPFIHAEMSILEHFLSSKRVFYHDKYIACSKPPCYCCELYGSIRNSNIEMQPAHGNAYPKWFPPYQQIQGDSQLNSVQDRVLMHMIEHMKRVVHEQLVRGVGGGRGKTRDSATDISTTLPSMRMPM